MIEKMTWWPLCKSEFSDNDDDFLEMTCLFWSPHYCRLQQKTCNNKLQQNWRFLKLFFLLKMGCFCSNCHEVLGAILTGRKHYLGHNDWLLSAPHLWPDKSWWISWKKLKQSYDPRVAGRSFAKLDNPKALTTNVDFSLTSTVTVSWGVTWKTDRLPPKMGPNSYLYLLVSLGKFFLIFGVISGNHDRFTTFLGESRYDHHANLDCFSSRFIGSDSWNILSRESSQEGYWSNGWFSKESSSGKV